MENQLNIIDDVIEPGRGMEKAKDRAIERIGSVKKVAKLCGISVQAVYNWTRVPATRVLTVERHSGISRHALRPDVFGRR